MQIFKTVINAFFPNTCISCGDIIQEDEYFCDYCYDKLERVDITKICLKCAASKKNCECKNRLFYYNGMIAPFYTRFSAKDAMYRYKFQKQERNVKFFANQISIMVKTVYGDIDFDAVVPVPLSFRKRLNRGFNQAEVLAKEISKILGIPVINGLLYCKGKRTNQHETKDIKQRFKNVQGLYGYRYKIKGKIVLLVDDIKTTGATLNECARQLILSGADKVYCVTGLITERKKKNGN